MENFTLLDEVQFYTDQLQFSASPVRTVNRLIKLHANIINDYIFTKHYGQINIKNKIIHIIVFKQQSITQHFKKSQLCNKKPTKIYLSLGPHLTLVHLH